MKLVKVKSVEKVEHISRVYGTLEYESKLVGLKDISTLHINPEKIVYINDQTKDGVRFAEVKTECNGYFLVGPESIEKLVEACA